MRVNIGFPVVRTDGRTVTWLPNFLGWVDYHISLAMGLRPRAREARAWSSAINFLVDFSRVFIHALVGFDLFRTLFWWSTSGFQVIGSYLFCSRIQLNSDQREIVDFATTGHNLFITGQGGVGKSECRENVHRVYTIIIQDLSVIWTILGQEYPPT